MSTVRLTQRARWQAYAALLWRTAPRQTVVYGVLLLAVGVLSTLAILATGALVAAVPGAVQQGLDSGEGRAFWLALAVLIATQALLIAGTASLTQLARALDRVFSLEVHTAVALAALTPTAVAPLEQPAFVNRLQVVEEAE